MPTITKKSEETRERLLNVASEHFAAKGYRQTRVADICREAEANQASISYHFRGKYELYLSTLHHALGLASKKFPLLPESDKSIEERLKGFLSTMLYRIFDPSEGSLFPRMLVKEMAEPTEALDTIMRELIENERNVLRSIVRDSLGPTATEEDIMLTHISMVSLFQFFNFSRSIRELVARKKKRLPPDIEVTIAHTVSFAIAGLNQKIAEIEARA